MSIYFLCQYLITTLFVSFTAMSRPSSTLFHHAIATGDIETITALLKQGVVDADTRFQIDGDVLETASRKSLSSLQSYRQQSMTANDLIVEEEGCNDAMFMQDDAKVTKKDLTIIEDQDEEDDDEDCSRSFNKEDKLVFDENADTVTPEGMFIDGLSENEGITNEQDGDVREEETNASAIQNYISPKRISITEPSTKAEDVSHYGTATIENNSTAHQVTEVEQCDLPSLSYSLSMPQRQFEKEAADTSESENEVSVTPVASTATSRDDPNEPAVASVVDRQLMPDNNDEIDAIDKIMEECQYEAEEENKEDTGEKTGGGIVLNMDREGYLQAEPLIISTQQHEASSDNENAAFTDHELVEPRVPVQIKMERLKDPESRPNSGNFFNNNNNNDRRSLADTIDLKLRDANGGLFERAPSMRVKEMTNNENDEAETSSTPKKLIPRLKRKISLKFTNRKPKKDFLGDDGDDFEDEMIYQNLVKTKNVDDEQLNENFEGVAFFEAVRDGMDMIVTTLLETSDNYQLNMLDDNGFTPAMQAAWHGQAECLQILISHGANTDLRNATGCTATHFAAGQGRAECLQLLIDDDCEQIDVKTKFGATPLILAAKGGHTECVEILLESGADPNTQYRGNQNALLFAAGNGHYECLEALIEKGVELNQPNSQNVTPLMRAVQQGHNTCVALLTDKGASIDLQDAIGRTALHFAIEHNNPKGLKLLLQSGANFELKTKGGSKPYAYAERFHNARCAEMLENHINKLKEEFEKENHVETQKQIVQEKEHNKVSCLSFKHIFRRRSRKNSKTQAPNS